MRFILPIWPSSDALSAITAPTPLLFSRKLPLGVEISVPYIRGRSISISCLILLFARMHSFRVSSSITGALAAHSLHLVSKSAQTLSSGGDPSQVRGLWPRAFVISHQIRQRMLSLPVGAP